MGNLFSSIAGLITDNWDAIAGTLASLGILSGGWLMWVAKLGLPVKWALQWLTKKDNTVLYQIGYRLGDPIQKWGFKKFGSKWDDVYEGELMKGSKSFFNGLDKRLEELKGGNQELH